MNIVHYGHACVLLETGPARLLFDPGPFSSGFEGLTGLDAVLITHQHFDHLDMGILSELLPANPKARLFADSGSAHALAEHDLHPTVLRPADSVSIAGTSVTGVGGDHAVIHPDIPIVPNIGYLVDHGAFYHPGDAFFVPPQEIDVLALPTGGPWLKLAEAVDFLRGIAPRVAVPIHEAILASPGFHYRVFEDLAPAESAVKVLDCGKPAAVLRHAEEAEEMAASQAPLTVAIVGSGPSGFYTASALLERPGLDVRVDMFERLPTPWGLVRFGVAPDHPKIKSVAAVFEKIAAHESFRFFGNIAVGTGARGIGRDELVQRYDAVIYAVGTQGGRRLGIPGEDLLGSVTAADFVGWYNGHPDCVGLNFDLSSPRAVVIGNGNVALDVARILCTPVERLAKTDIADHALEALRRSSVTEIWLVGRRGPGQAAFTTPELRELPEFTGSRVDVNPAEVADVPGEDALPRVAKRNLAVLREYAANDAAPGSKHIALRFQRSPVELCGDGRVQHLVLGRNELRLGPDGSVAAYDTGEREVVETGLVLSAVGYRGLAIPGLPFDDRRGIIPNEQGRVAGSEREYTVGWIKRGPTGIIGTNKKDAAETVRRLLADLAGGALRRHRAGSSEGIVRWLAERKPDLVTEQGWRLINAAERAAGEQAGRPRIKLCHTRDLLRVALPSSTFNQGR